MARSVTQWELRGIVVAHSDRRPGVESRELVLPELGDRVSLRISRAAVDTEEVDVRGSCGFASRVAVLAPFVGVDELGGAHAVACELREQMLPILARTLRTWRSHTKYKTAGDGVFASPHSNGRKPYWGQSLMRNQIRKVARGVGITKRIGWHTFRHTCATLLRASGAEHQGCLGAPPACLLPHHPRYLHPGRHRTEASGAKQDRRFGARTQATDSPDVPSSRALTAVSDKV